MCYIYLLYYSFYKYNILKFIINIKSNLFETSYVNTFCKDFFKYSKIGSCTYYRNKILGNLGNQERAITIRFYSFFML